MKQEKQSEGEEKGSQQEPKKKELKIDKATEAEIEKKFGSHLAESGTLNANNLSLLSSM